MSLVSDGLPGEGLGHSPFSLKRTERNKIMSKNRIRITAPAIKTRAEMEHLIGEIAKLTLQRNALTLEMDRQMSEIRSRFEADLGPVQKTLEEKTAVAQDWAESNPSEFGKLKSIEFVHGQVGFRTGKPTVKTLSGWTWDRVLEALRGLAWAKSLIRTEETVNKQGILDQRESLTSEELRQIGVRIVQDESFYIEPKLQELANKIVEAA
jgi:phage host-nuclease inhibitor protein Gam